MTQTGNQHEGHRIIDAQKELLRVSNIVRGDVQSDG
jgi:hypothetical protein